MQDNTTYPFIMDFGTAKYLDHDVLVAFYKNTLQPVVQFVELGSYVYLYYAYTGFKISSIALNQWYHMCSTYNGQILANYLNANFVQQTNVTLPLSTTTVRTNAYFGWSTMPEAEAVDFYLDDVIFLNKALAADQVAYLYTYNV